MLTNAQKWGKKTLENLEEGLAWDNTVITDLSQNFDQLCSSLGPRQTCGIVQGHLYSQIPRICGLKSWEYSHGNYPMKTSIYGTL